MKPCKPCVVCGAETDHTIPLTADYSVYICPQVCAALVARREGEPLVMASRTEQGAVS